MSLACALAVLLKMSSQLVTSFATSSFLLVKELRRIVMASDGQLHAYLRSVVLNETDKRYF